MQFSALETVPVSVGDAAGDAVVYPAWRNVEGEFVIQDCLERRDDLDYVRKMQRVEKIRSENVAGLELKEICRW